MALHAYKESKDWQELVSSDFDKLREARAAYEENLSSFRSEFGKVWRESFDSSVEVRDKYSERAELFGHLAHLIPLILVYLFYFLRWVIIGRFRPLIVK